MFVRRQRHFLASGGALAVAFAVSVAFAASVGSPATVSDPSPFASCTVGGPGTAHTNAEVEPWIAVNPTNASNIIGVWQQDRWDNGGARALMAGYSTDGGATWGRTALPFTVCAGGQTYERASDPWVSFGPDGKAYTVSLSFNQNATSSANAVLAATSTDGGQTWGNVKTIIADTSIKFFNDKESVTADPITPGVAYAVWDRLESPNDNPDANLHAAAYRGPTYFSKTTDGGVTWSAPKAIVDFTSSRKQTIGNQIVVNRQNGALYNFFDLITPPFKVTSYKLAFIKSTDGGNSWTKPQIIADMQTLGVTDPNTGAPVRTGDIIPEAAIDPNNGTLYAVWQDSRFSGRRFDEVAFSTSTDGGATWSAPKRINTPTGRPAFTPSVEVSSNGTVGITYYDFRNLAAGNTTTLPTDYWFVSSSNGGASFGTEAHVAGPFDMMTAPDARGFFVGDYEGLATSGTSFKSLYVQANSGNTSNRTDVVATTITP